ncbi:MAG: hypothetical protein AAB701_02280 [Patescibacteria group bacterium]
MMKGIRILMVIAYHCGVIALVVLGFVLATDQPEPCGNLGDLPCTIIAVRPTIHELGYMMLTAALLLEAVYWSPIRPWLEKLLTGLGVIIGVIVGSVAVVFLVGLLVSIVTVIL